MAKNEPGFIQIDIAGITLEILTKDIFQSQVRSASHVLHEHAIYEIYYIEAGKMVFECEKTHTLSSGDLFVISSKTPHRVIDYSENMRWFHFRFRILPENSGVPVKSHLFHNFKQDITDRLIQNIRSYNPNSDNNMAEYRFRCDIGMLMSYVLESFEPQGLEKSAENHKNQTRQSRIISYSQIDTFLYDNCAGAVHLEDLARHLNYSKVQTARLVRECCGMSFSEKLREIRIRLAKELLSASEMPISKIAECCGYQTRQGFETAFMHIVGITPSAYKNRQNRKI